MPSVCSIAGMCCVLAHNAHRLPSGGCTMQTGACLECCRLFWPILRTQGVQVHLEAAAYVQLIDISGIADHVGPCTIVRQPDGNEARVPLLWPWPPPSRAGAATAACAASARPAQPARATT